MPSPKLTLSVLAAIILLSYSVPYNQLHTKLKGRSLDLKIVQTGFKVFSPPSYSLFPLLTATLCYNRRSISDIFRIHVIASTTTPTSPLITLGSTTFFHVRHQGLWLVAVTKNVSTLNYTMRLGKTDTAMMTILECKCCPRF